MKQETQKEQEQLELPFDMEETVELTPEEVQKLSHLVRRARGIEEWE